MTTAQKWVLTSKFEGDAKLTDFTLQEEELPPIKDGEFLCEAVVLSVDPYMRLFGNNSLGSTFLGEQVARVTESKHADFTVGSYVALNCGWRTKTVTDGKDVRPVPRMDGLPVSLALGILGMPGGTAYFGLYEICGASEGEVVFVNGAAGAVGSTVGQLAKAKGCTVIGCASSEEKLAFLRDIGFDHVFNYKTRSVADALEEYAPDGLDVFYDNIAGPGSMVVYEKMKHKGRVAVGGTMSGYNDAGGPGAEQKGALPYHLILMKELRVQGFTFWSFMSRRSEAEDAVRDLISQGKVKYHEKVVKGFDKMPQALIDVMSGKSLGKTVVLASTEGEVPTYSAA